MLNDMQQKAVQSNKNVNIIIAGAGSGKTTVLTQRIVRLVNEGKNPENILAITFTNKAAQEMRDRLQEELGVYIHQATVSTFHALAVKIIRENISYLKYHNRNFLIVDDEDKKKIFKEIIKESNSEFKGLDVMYSISSAKSVSLTYDNVRNIVQPEYLDIYDKYSKYLQVNNAFDFDDLLLVCYHLLKEKDVKTKYNKKFLYIHVDEYQDTSTIQSEILRKLKDKENTLFVVGDIDQSIYTWRGANIDNLLNLESEYDDVELIRLEQNYRSTKKILDAANSLIQNNKKRLEKNLWTENKKGSDISYQKVNSNIDEANLIVREINSVADYGTSYDNFAVLYRYNYQSRKIEEALLKNKIPYKIYGGIRFYERMEVKDILAYIRLFINPNDNISLNRVMNVPKRKAGEKTIEKLKLYSKDNDCTLFDAIREIGSKGLNKFVDIIEKYKYLSEELDSKTFEEGFNKFLLELGYEEYLLTLDDSTKVEERMENIKELKEGIVQELELDNNLVEYINEISLYNNSEEFEDEVVLSTIHGVKGLEFENVFMIGMIEGKFPKEAANFSEDEMEEERRLAYVGITRAKRNLTLTSYTFDYQYHGEKPSRFIEEIGIKVEEDLDGFIF